MQHKELRRMSGIRPFSILTKEHRNNRMKRIAGTPTAYAWLKRKYGSRLNVKLNMFRKMVDLEELPPDIIFKRKPNAMRHFDKRKLMEWAEKHIVS